MKAGLPGLLHWQQVVVHQQGLPSSPGAAPLHLFGLGLVGQPFRLIPGKTNLLQAFLCDAGTTQFPPLPTGPLGD